MRNLFDNRPVMPAEGFASRYTPRPYQLEARDSFFQLTDAGADGALVRLCTGGGKTFIGSWIGSEWVSRSDDHYVMVIAHERQLVSQFAEEIEDLLGVRVGLEMATDGRVIFGGRDTPRFIVASRATLEDRDGLSRLYKFDWRKHWLLICDECHRWTYGMKSCRHIVDWFSQNPTSKRLGLTATPERGDGVTFERLFPAVALDYRMYDLDGGPSAVNDGWAVPYQQHYIEVSGIDFKNLSEVAGDYDAEELDVLLSEKEQLDSLIQPMLETLGDKRAIIFNPGVRMAKAVADAINAEREYRLKQGELCPWGEAKSLDGSADREERNQVFSEHQSGQIQFLSVCNLCREGYNDPSLEAVVIFRPTKSRSLAEQMKGRGCRVLKGLVDGLETAEERKAAIAASNKPHCMIVDLVGVSGLEAVASTAQLIAEGKPDEVIERANQNARKKTGSIDLAAEIRQAEEELVEEARQKAEEERQARAREAAKLARIRSSVRYRRHELQPGETIDGEQKTPKVELTTMPFGKFRGKRIFDLPTWYLEWGVDTQSGELLQKFQEVLALRQRKQRSLHAGPATEQQVRVLSRHGITMPENMTFAQAGELITSKLNPLLTGA